MLMMSVEQGFTIDDHYHTCTCRFLSKDGSARTFLVESLVHQCYHYIAMNRKKFPVSYLSLLPGLKRLWRLRSDPASQTCLLEDTKYVEGFRDMAAYWKHPCEDFQGT